MTTENSHQFARNAADISEEYDLRLYGNSFTTAWGERIDPTQVKAMPDPSGDPKLLKLLVHRAGSEGLYYASEFHHRTDVIHGIALTADEKRVLSLTADLWNSFLLLPKQHPSDASEFQLAIHQLQALIALRVARRANPEVWR